MEDLKNKTIRSIVAVTGRQMFSQIVTLLTFVPLGALLSVKAMGVYFAVTALYPFFNYLIDWGLGAALIQKRDEPETDDLRTVFSFQMIFVFTATAIGFLLTGKIATYAHLSSDGIHLYWILLFVLFISSFKSIPSILLERKIAFEKQVIPTIIEQITFSVVVVFLAYKGFEVSSYTWAYFASALMGLPIYYFLSPWPIGFCFSLNRFKKLFGFGFLYQGKSFLALIKDNLLTIFLSGTPAVGTVGLGQIGWWQKWAYSPYNFFTSSVTKVTFPTYARIQEDKQNLKIGLEKSLFAVGLLLFPVLTGMALLIGRFLELFPVYQKWSAGLPSFYFFCAAAAVSSLSGIMINVLDATGRVKTTLYLMVLWIALTWPATIILTKLFGFNGVAAANFLVTLTIILTVYLVKKVVNFSFLANIYPAVAGTVAMSIAVSLINNLFISVIAGAIIYIITVWFLAHGKIKNLFFEILMAYKK